MGKRVYELAKELEVEAKQIVALFPELGIEVKAGQRPHLFELSDRQEQLVRDRLATQKGAGVEVTRLGGGRIVRRRAPAAQVARQEAEPAQPVVAPVAEPPPVVPVVEAAAAEEKPLPEQPPVQQPEPVAPTPPTPPAPVEVAVPQVTEEPKVEVVAEVSAPEPEPVEPKKEPEPKPTPKKAQPTLRPEVPDRQAKIRKLIYDRRRDVISLRDLLHGADEEIEKAPVRPVPKRKKMQRGRKQKPVPAALPKEQKRIIKVEGEVIQVGELARHIGVKAGDLVKKLMEMGVMVSVTQPIDVDTAAILASEYGYTVEKVGFDPAAFLRESPDPPEALKPRPPVVTIMGHVDHGKTTLLDRIRKTRVAESEAGGITQHIGAYKVSIAGGDIVFLDTPGHEAFTAMRARGARVTDIVVLVVAADDGVKAQTLEAIAHARDAGAPMLVAINKIDKPEANVERVKKELAEQGLIPEEWGGQTIFCEISAKKGIGIENLLEMILLQSQIMELKANPEKSARGVVIEARLDKQVGPLATVLVQSGTLRVGDVVIAGLAYGHVRRMTDDQGRPLSAAGPVTPVQVAGLNLVPNAGDTFVVVPDEKRAKEIAEWQMEQMRKAREARALTRVTLEDFYKMAQAGGAKVLKVVLRADVQGSLGAILDSLDKIKHPEIQLKVIHSAVGVITEGDVQLAIASDAVVVGFNVGVDPKAQALADHEKVEIRRYTVIYELLEDIRKAMEGLLQPKRVAKMAGVAEVRQVFNISKIGKVAGLVVTSGRALRSAEVKVLRGGRLVFEGKIASLKRFKEDVKEVKQGFECGLALEGFEDFEVGDRIEFYEFETVRETIPA